MKLTRRLLGFVWTLAAAIPLASRYGDHTDPPKPGAATARGAPGLEARASAGQPRVGPGESVLRQVRTPFVPATPFTLHLGTRVVAFAATRDRSVARAPALFLPRSRAPPVLH